MKPIMCAARLDEVGPPENVKIVECPTPMPGPEDVLIKVGMAGLIYGDAEARKGTYFGPTAVPWFPGREAAGEIVAVGAGVKVWRPGDRVVALVLTQGCCAEYVLASTRPRTLPSGKRIPPADIHRLPSNVSFGEALVYLVNFRLAHLLFHGSSRVPPGATVLIHGASGGMGTMLVQLAKAHGCTAIGTCRRSTEAQFLAELGADHVINVTDTDYVATVREITNGKGIPFVFNGVGGSTINTDIDIMSPFGELHAYGYVAGKGSFDVFRVPKTIALKTFAADDFFNTPMFPAATEAMHGWFQSGRLLQPGLVLPLTEIAEAMRRLDRGDVPGKIVLQP